MKNYHQPSLPSTPLTQTTLLQKGLMNQVVSKVIPPKALQVDNQSSPSEKQQLYNEQYYEQHDEQHEVQHQVQHDRQHDGQQPQLQQQNLVSNESINENYNLNGRNLTQYTQHYDSNETLSDDLRYRSLTKQSNTNRSFMSKLSIVNRKNFTRFTRSKVTFLTINTLVRFLSI